MSPGPMAWRKSEVSVDALSFIALLLVLVVLALLAGICVAAVVDARSKAERVMFSLLALTMLIGFAITTAVMR